MVLRHAERPPFPPLRLPREEDDQLQALAHLLVDEYLVQHDDFRQQSCGRVQAEWRFVTQRNHLQVLQQRRNSLTQTSSGLPRLRAAGWIAGTLEDVIYATVAPTTMAAHVKMAALKGDDVDARVLHTVSYPTAAKPFRFVGIKWLLRRAPTGLQGLVRQRDFVFLEATGMILRSDGERIGYHVCHSVEFSTTPALSRRAIVRGRMAMCHLYRQLSPGKVDVWATATLDMQGDMWHKLVIAEGSTAILAVCDLTDLAHRRKLRWLLDERGPRVGVTTPTNATRSRSVTRSSGGQTDGSRRCRTCNDILHWLWRRRHRCDLCGWCVCLNCIKSTTLTREDSDHSANKRNCIRCCIACVSRVRTESALEIAILELEAQAQHEHPMSASPTRHSEDDDSATSPDPSQTPPRATRLFKKPTRRARAGSAESTSTTKLTSSTLSRQSVLAWSSSDASTATDRQSHAPTSSSRGALSVDYVETLTRLQVVADATYAEQRERANHLEVPHSRVRPRKRASSTPWC